MSEVRRDDDGRAIRGNRPCDICHNPTHLGAQHASECIFGAEGRYALTGPNKASLRSVADASVVVSDYDADTAVVRSGEDITICSPRQAEELLAILGRGHGYARLLKETIDAARRRDEWAAIQ